MPTLAIARPCGASTVVRKLTVLLSCPAERALSVDSVKPPPQKLAPEPSNYVFIAWQLTLSHLAPILAVYFPFGPQTLNKVCHHHRV